MADCRVAALAVELTPENWSGSLTVRAALDGSVTNSGVGRYRELANRHLDVLERHHLGADVIFLLVRTNQSSIHVAQAARTRLYRDGLEIDAERRVEDAPDAIAQEITTTADEGESILVEKIVAIHTSLDRASSEPGLEAKRTLAYAGRFEDVLGPHALAWTHLWDDCDISLEDHAAADTELELRVYIFHLLQTVSPNTIDRDAGVPARGWHGEAYRGHIFWDELFIFPFLNLRLPTLTRALLRYRYRRLTEARRAALEAGYRGAMYPWQSGSDGREESQRVHLNPRSGRWIPDNTFRQRHISAAIAYNIWQYHQASDDHEFLYFYGAEMLLEIARFWASIATYDGGIDRYVIRDVVGPDEYHTAYPGASHEEARGVNDNAYTNVMAAWVLNRASDVLALLPKSQCHDLCERIGLSPDERERWQDVSRKLRVPFHGDGIISQFDGYDQLLEFDWDAYREKYGDIQRLDRILEAEGDTTNRYKLSKQADVLMLFYLFSADELKLIFEQLGYPFDADTIPRNVAYYLARTSHGSTLSRVAHAWVLARTDRPRSWHLFHGALDSDISDIQGGTTPEGIHVGAMAGTIDLIQRCYLGIEMRGNVLHFDPAFPADLERVRARLRYRRHTLDIEADHDALRIRSRPQPAAPITIGYRGRFRHVTPGDTYEFRLIKPEERDRDENRRPDLRQLAVSQEAKPSALVEETS